MAALSVRASVGSMIPSRPPGLLNGWILAGILFAVVASPMLTPFYGDEGSMQAAFVPLALGLYALFPGQLTVAHPGDPAAFVRLTAITAAVGPIPGSWILYRRGLSNS